MIDPHSSQIPTSYNTGLEQSISSVPENVELEEEDSLDEDMAKLQALQLAIEKVKDATKSAVVVKAESTEIEVKSAEHEIKNTVAAKNKEAAAATSFTAETRSAAFETESLINELETAKQLVDKMYSYQKTLSKDDFLRKVAEAGFVSHTQRPDSIYVPSMPGGPTDLFIHPTKRVALPITGSRQDRNPLEQEEMRFVDHNNNIVNVRAKGPSIAPEDVDKLTKLCFLYQAGRKALETKKKETERRDEEDRRKTDDLNESIKGEQLSREHLRDMLKQRIKEKRAEEFDKNIARTIEAQRHGEPTPIKKKSKLQTQREDRQERFKKLDLEIRDQIKASQKEDGQKVVSIVEHGNEFGAIKHVVTRQDTRVMGSPINKTASYADSHLHNLKAGAGDLPHDFGAEHHFRRAA